MTSSTRGAGPNVGSRMRKLVRLFKEPTEAGTFAAGEGSVCTPPPCGVEVATVMSADHPGPHLR